MKLGDYAKQAGVRYETAWRWFRDGKIKGHRVGEHTIIITERETEAVSIARDQVAIYARVSAAEHRPNLDSQAERLVAYCEARGYPVSQIVKEVGSGVNDSRPKLLKLLSDSQVGVIVVEHKDRLTRSGFRYIETLLALNGRRIEVVNLAENGRGDLWSDLTAIIYAFCARLYGQGRVKRQSEKITQALNAHD
jgi:predicted site-specific integrase-resolvase